MRRVIAALVIASLSIPVIHAQRYAITRRDGFVRIWETILRPAEPAPTAFTDLPETEPGSLEIDYAVKRGIIDDGETFNPEDSLTVQQALIWLYRTRNVAYPLDINIETLQSWINRYPIAPEDKTWIDSLTHEELDRMIADFDALLKSEVHEVSFYSENFHGAGTAFGEKFDMYAYTAAHRTYPHNTVVRVTHIDDGKTVVVRINDRGPFVEGRDMDLSYASFIHITERSRGYTNARFERLGNIDLLREKKGTEDDVLTAEEWELLAYDGGESVPDEVEQDSVAEKIVEEATEEEVLEEEVIVQREPTCVEPGRGPERFIRDVFFLPSLPKKVEVGYPLTFGAQTSFVVRHVSLPDGSQQRIEDWILTGEDFTYIPEEEGVYQFHLQGVTGGVREIYIWAENCR